MDRANRTGWNPTATYFWSFASPFIQSKGTSQGLFFDAGTMDITVNTRVFREVAQMYYDLSNCGPYLNTSMVRAHWLAGRCAIAMDWGNIATLPQKNTSTVANVTVMSLPPGSRRVYNRDTQQLEECTKELCPLADSNGVNRAPFAATLGWTSAVSRFIPESRKNAAYGFLSYISQPSNSIQAVLLGSGWDVVRESQMQSDIFISSGWTNLTATSMVVAARGAQNHLNAVVDLPLEKWSEYYQIFGTKMSAFIHDEISLDELQSGISREWDSLLDKYGRREQHIAYALSIGAHRPVFDNEVTLPDALRISFIVISCLCVFIVIGLVVFVILHRNKKVCGFNAR